MSLYELAMTVPWFMTSTGLNAMLAVAAREEIPRDELARAMHGPKSLALRNGERHPATGRIDMRGSIATIRIEGPIFRYADFFTSMSGGVTTEQLARDFQIALSDPTVSSILFVVDSPGGESTGINELSDAIYNARGRKPIVAYVEGQGASAAYFIASAADYVAADAAAMLGSIGTVISAPDPTKTTSRSITFVSSQSPKKRPDPTTDEGRATIQQLADDLTEVFIEKVMRNRGITRDQVVAIEGRQLVGRHAVEAGLADVLASEDELLQLLSEGRIPMRVSTLELPPVAIETQARTQEVPVMSDSKHSEQSQKSGFWAWITGSDTPSAPPPTASAPPVLQARHLAPGEQLVQGQLPSGTVAQSAVASLESQADPQMDKLRAEVAELRAARIRQDAEAWASAELGAGHLLPADQSAAVALYTRAAELDAVTVQAAGTPTNVELVKAAYSARPANRLASNLLSNSTPATVLPSNPSTAPSQMDEELAEVKSFAERLNGTGQK